MIISRSIHVPANGMVLRMNSGFSSVTLTLCECLLHSRLCALCLHLHLIALVILITALCGGPYSQRRKLSHRRTLPKVTRLRNGRWGSNPCLHSVITPPLVSSSKALGKGQLYQEACLYSNRFTISKFYDLKKYSVQRFRLQPHHPGAPPVPLLILNQRVSSSPAAIHHVFKGLSFTCKMGCESPSG